MRVSPYRLCWLLLMVTFPAHAELVVIVNADRGIERIAQEDVVNIFMGRNRLLADGEQVQPLDIAGEASERREFYRTLVDKTLGEIDAYWARLVFSGRTLPPETLETASAVLERVGDDRNAIGYVDRQRLNRRVKPVYTLPQ